MKRAKTVLRRKVMHNRLDFMVTLTVREEIEDRDRFAELVSSWIRSVKARLRDWDCITVLEVQEQRAARTGKRVWHAHVAVKGWQKLGLLRKLWQGIVGPYEGKSGGAVNVQAPPGYGKGRSQWDMVRLARYLCKYLTKLVGEDHILDKKSYWHTRGIDDPPALMVLVAIGTEEYWARYLVQAPGRRTHTWTDFNGAIGRTANF